MVLIFTMKKIYLLLFFVLFFGSLKAQTITFSDQTFKSKLLESSSSNFIARNLNGDYFSIDANSNNEIELTEALEVAFLEIDNSSISSLSGINNFTNLLLLSCENNLLTNLNVSGLINLTTLNCSSNQLGNLNVNGLTELQNLNCQFNQLTNLNVNGITNLEIVNCSYNLIASLVLNNLLNLTEVNCNDNLISSIDLTDLISLISLNCSNNRLSSLDTTNLVSLELLNCNTNLLVSLTINGLVNFNELDCSNNLLTSLNLINTSNLSELNCNFNQLTLINLSGLIGLINFSCSNNILIAIDLDGLTQLEDVNCSNNLITTISFLNTNQLQNLNCDNNQLVTLAISDLTNLKYLYCNNNSIIDLNTNGLNALLVLSCNANEITTLNLSSTNNLQSLYCSNNQIATLNLSNLFNFQNLFCSNNVLTSLFIKNGSFENNLQFAGNPTLEYICADPFQMEFIQDEINNNNYTNCHVNSYCSFVPGGISYTIQGNSKFDSNTNGCDALDTVFPTLQMSFSDGSVTENLFANNSGNFSKSIINGSYTITPIVENSNYFSIAPSTVSVAFPSQSSPFAQNFCITPNGNHNDLEIAILPVNNAIPNLESKYKIVYKNKGTTTQSGTINLNFNDAVLNFVSSNPVNSSQSTNNLNWIFTSLNPLETRSILVTLKANSSTDTPAVNIGQLLPFSASITTAAADETPNDNTISFIQKVADSTTTNDKVCIEGNSISTSQVGEYVHYCIRFTNNGNAIAQNVVVKDIIDLSKYDIATVIPLDASAIFETRVTNSNTIEFIFETINLGFASTNNAGYVLFKIKTLPTLSEGDIFSNSATIYFDFKTPLSTNNESTIIQVLANQTFVSSENFIIYPNPVKEVLTIHSSDVRTVDTISIYNSLGQLMKHMSNPSNLSLNVSDLSKGIYFINIISENVKTSFKFIKE
jgi:uncharacterized repeat protein (TIGR01451 family)